MADCTPLNNCFEIHTIGDLQVFTAMLNGVAMVFNQGGIAGDGIGLLAATGLLVSLLGILIAGVMTQKVDIGQFFLLIVVFWIMFVPKVTVLLQDTVTSNVAAVDNVPIGVALPGHFISAFSRSITESFEIGYRNIDSNFLMDSTGADSGLSNSMVGKAGITPLKLLRSLKTASTAAAYDTYLADDLVNLVSFCVVGNGDFDESKMMKNPSLVNDVLTVAAASGRLTAKWSITVDSNGKRSGVQVPSSCADLAGELKVKVSTSEGSAFSALVKEYINTTNPPLKSSYNKASGTATATADTFSGYDIKDISRSLGLINAEWSNKAADSIQLAFFSSLINDAFRCSNANSSQGKLADCFAMSQAQEQAREDGAGAGSMFQKIMVHGMNIMLAMFYLLSPIVAIVMISSGAKGFKIAFSFLLFGVWSQSWLPVSVAINAYLYAQVAQEVQMLGQGGLTIANMPQFYDILGTKIGLAGELLGAVPLLSLAILSGSIFSLTSIANRLSGKDYYDEKLNAPSVAASAPAMQMAPMLTGTMGQAGSTMGGYGSGPTVSASGLISGANEARQQLQLQASAGASQTYAQQLSKLLSSDRTGSIQKQMVNSLRSSGSHDLADKLEDAIASSSGFDKSRKFSKNNLRENSYTESEMAELGIKGTTPGASSIAPLVGSVAKNAATLAKVTPLGAVMGAVGLNGGYSEKANTTKKVGDTQTIENADVKTEGERSSINAVLLQSKLASLGYGKNFDDSRALLQAFKKVSSAQDSESVERSLSMARSATEAASRISSETSSLGVSGRLTGEQFKNLVADRPELARMLDQVQVSDTERDLARMGANQTMNDTEARRFAAGIKLANEGKTAGALGQQLFSALTGSSNAGSLAPVKTDRIKPGDEQALFERARGVEKKASAIPGSEVKRNGLIAEVNGGLRQADQSTRNGADDVRQHAQKMRDELRQEYIDKELHVSGDAPDLSHNHLTPALQAGMKEFGDRQGVIGKLAAVTEASTPMSAFDDEQRKVRERAAAAAMSYLKTSIKPMLDQEMATVEAGPADASAKARLSQRMSAYNQLEQSIARAGSQHIPPQGPGSHGPKTKQDEAFGTFQAGVEAAASVVQEQRAMIDEYRNVPEYTGRRLMRDEDVIDRLKQIGKWRW